MKAVKHGEKRDEVFLHVEYSDFGRTDEHIIIKKIGFDHNVAAENEQWCNLF